jgi:hypothetical protein
MVRLLALLAAALVVPAVLPATAGNAYGQAAYVHEMSGTVTGTLGAQTRNLRQGDIIAAGTTVTTGDRSRAVIKFEDGQVMALAERSSFRIVEYRYVKERVRDSNAVFALLQGGLRFISGVIGSTNRNNFRLTAGTATIGIRGTDGNVYYNSVVGAVNAAVNAGQIAVTTPAGTQNLGRGESFGDASAAVQQAFAQLSAQLMPINTPVVIAASAAAAEAAADAARLNTPEARERAQRLLEIAIQEAQKAYQQAIDGGAVPPDTSGTTTETSIPTSTQTSSPTGAAGAGGGGGTAPCTPASASPC